jgi:diadenosine tetraphosphatase ApaH/serine/threonine PP2A family protein phosphatase
MDFAGCSEWIENLLATLVTLRVFGAYFNDGGPYYHTGRYLPFITQVSNRAPKLEHFTIFNGESHYWKQVRGEWVLSDDERFPPVRAFGM